MYSFLILNLVKELHLLNIHFSNTQRVLSYTMDANENVFLKFWNDKIIYKLTINGNKAINITFNLNTYYNISSSSIESVRNNAENFVLYNVTGYIGSIMMLLFRIVNKGSEINNDINLIMKIGE